jgi:parallel beta-helix repeat protein
LRLQVQNGNSQNFGGLYANNTNGAVTVNKNIIKANVSQYDGGGAAVSSRSYREIILANNIITENSSGRNGGGVYTYDSSSNNYGAETVFINNVITDNTANNNGGGIYAYAYQREIFLINNSVTGNSSSGSGGGVYFSNYYYGQEKLYNNIIWGNTASAGGDIYIYNPNSYSGTINADNNDFDPAKVTGSFTNQANNINVDPLFMNAAEGNYHLSAGSPCIDSGSNEALLLPLTDFESDTRILYAAVDIGADEYVTDTTAPETTISGAPANPSNEASANFSFASSESWSTFECQLDGGIYEICTSPMNYTGLTEGTIPLASRRQTQQRGPNTGKLRGQLTPQRRNGHNRCPSNKRHVSEL